MSTRSSTTTPPTETGPYSPANLSRLSRADLEFGLQTQLLVLELQLACFRARYAKAREVRGETWMGRGRNAVFAGQWLALAHEALDEAEKTMRNVGRLLTFMGSQEAEGWAAAMRVSALS
jgi:hypothetical protein